VKRNLDQLRRPGHVAPAWARLGQAARAIRDVRKIERDNAKNKDHRNCYHHKSGTVRPQRYPAQQQGNSGDNEAKEPCADEGMPAEVIVRQGNQVATQSEERGMTKGGIASIATQDVPTGSQHRGHHRHHHHVLIVLRLLNERED
jgi:hypothetical protein